MLENIGLKNPIYAEPLEKWTNGFESLKDTDLEQLKTDLEEIRSLSLTQEEIDRLWADLRYLSLLYASFNKPNLSIEFGKSAIAWCPKNLIMHESLIPHLASHQRFDEALNVIEQMYLNMPDDQCSKIAWSMIALHLEIDTLLKIGRWDDALKTLEALEILHRKSIELSIALPCDRLASVLITIWWYPNFRDEPGDRVLMDEFGAYIQRLMSEQN
jgi:tetratricopeptide (TPR) repeat protein